MSNNEFDNYENQKADSTLPEKLNKGVAFWIAVWTWAAIAVLYFSGWIFAESLSYAIFLVWGLAFYGGFLALSIGAIVAIVELFQKRSLWFSLAALVLCLPLFIVFFVL
jgi:hypothetical protein